MYDKKSDQIITNLSTVKYKQPVLVGPLGSINPNLTLGKNMADTIKRSNSKQANDSGSNRQANDSGSYRPSTAPTKQEKPEKKENSRNVYNTNGSNKRLPSPMINCKNSF